MPRAKFKSLVEATKLEDEQASRPGGATRPKSAVGLNVNESRTHNFVREMRRRGIRVSEYATGDGYIRLRGLFRYLKDVAEADFVLCGLRLPSGLPWMAFARLMGKRVILDYPMDYTAWPFLDGRKWRWLVRQSIRVANRILTIRSRSYLIEKHHLPTNKVLFVEHCPDREQLEFSMQKPPRFDFSPGSFVICCSGGSTPHRLERFLPIYDALVEIMPEAELLIIADSSKEISKQAAARVSRNQRGRIHLLPVIKPVEDFFATLARCHMWVATMGDDSLQGQHELRMELLEAAILGRPIVTAKTPAFALHKFADTQEILYVDPNDPAGSARKIADLAKQPNAVAGMGEALRRVVLERFSLSQAVDRITAS